MELALRLKNQSNSMINLVKEKPQTTLANQGFHQSQEPLAHQQYYQHQEFHQPQFP